MMDYVSLNLYARACRVGEWNGFVGGWGGGCNTLLPLFLKSFDILTKCVGKIS